jgi:hypothetical protein
MRVHPLAPVVGVDIDGTLGDYHAHFTTFLRTVYLPHEMKNSPWAPQWRILDRGEFSDALGLDKTVYRAAKLAYRQGGFKRCMPQFEVDVDKGGVQRVIQKVRAMGVRVIITTTRPWLRLDNIDPDTVYWLDHNVGEVDGVIYGEDKYLDLIDIYGKENILGVFEDLPENVERAVELQLNVLMRRGDHNLWWREARRDQLRKAVHTTGRAVDLSTFVEEWKEEHDFNA